MTVKKGDLIAALDEESYRADVTKLEADLEAAIADVTAKDQNYQRVAGLVKTGAYSQGAADQMLGQRDTAAARVEAVRAAIVRAKVDLTNTVIKAPFDGRIVAVYPENFQQVRAQQQIARLLDLQTIEVVIDVPETMISLVPQVETMSARFDAFPDVELEARITEVGAEASENTRTYPVKLVMKQPANATILPGMSGSFKVKTTKTDAAQPVPVVPATALRPVAAKDASPAAGPA